MIYCFKDFKDYLGSSTDLQVSHVLQESFMNLALQLQGGNLEILANSKPKNCQVAQQPLEVPCCVLIGQKESQQYQAAARNVVVE